MNVIFQKVERTTDFLGNCVYAFCFFTNMNEKISFSIDSEYVSHQRETFGWFSAQVETEEAVNKFTINVARIKGKYHLFYYLDSVLKQIEAQFGLLGLGYAFSFSPEEIAFIKEYVHEGMRQEMREEDEEDAKPWIITR